MQLSVEQKDMMTCDDVLCLYLGYVAKQVNEMYYRNVLKFVLMFRDCMNQLGWQKRKSYLNKAGLLESDPMFMIAK
jgi:hypothetical protein